ncbi:hypothetical protein [Roseibium sp. M-1]
MKKSYIPKPLRRFFSKSATQIDTSSLYFRHGKEQKRICALSVIGYGRFGNNLLQIANALLLAKLLDLRFVQLPKLSWIPIEQPVEYDDLTLLPYDWDLSKIGPSLKSDFFSGPRFDVLSCGHSMRSSVLRQYIKPLLTFPTKFGEFDDQLVIHIRSGDIFSASPHPGYVQPPLAFYRRLIQAELEHRASLKLYVVFEDRRNPCVSGLERYALEIGVPLTMQSGSFHDDIGTLLSATKLAFGHGTMGLGVCLLSCDIDSVDVFGDSGFAYRNLSQIKRVTVWNALPDDYIAVGSWKNTDEQRNQMMNYPDEAIFVASSPNATPAEDAVWWITRA